MIIRTVAKKVPDLFHERPKSEYKGIVAMWMIAVLITASAWDTTSTNRILSFRQFPAELGHALEFTR